MNILKLFRNNSPSWNVVVNNTLRGAKKKSDKKSEQVLTEHILNMYKNCDDVPILPDQYYPPWVLELAKPQMNNEECYINSTYGITLPSAIEMHTIHKKARRMTKIKIKNEMILDNAKFFLAKDSTNEDDENMLDFENPELTDKMKKLMAEQGLTETGEKKK